MKPIIVTAAAIFLMSGPAASLAAGQSSPSSILTQHEAIIQDLSRYAGQGMPTADAARKVLDLLSSHQKSEEEFVIPLLSLLPEVCDGSFRGDVTSAIAMADHLKAERQTMFDSNAQIMTAMGELIHAGGAAHEQDLVDFGGRVATHVMGEIEVSEPAAILVGDALRQRLDAEK